MKKLMLIVFTCFVNLLFAQQIDLLIKNGHVIDPKNNIDAPVNRIEPAAGSSVGVPFNGSNIELFMPKAASFQPAFKILPIANHSAAVRVASVVIPSSAV